MANDNGNIVIYCHNIVWKWWIRTDVLQRYSRASILSWVHLSLSSWLSNMTSKTVDVSLTRTSYVTLCSCSALRSTLHPTDSDCSSPGHQWVHCNYSTSWAVIGQYSSSSIFWLPPLDESCSTQWSVCWSHAENFQAYPARLETDEAKIHLLWQRTHWKDLSSGL